MQASGIAFPSSCYRIDTNPAQFHSKNIRFLWSSIFNWLISCFDGAHVSHPNSRKISRACRVSILSRCTLTLWRANPTLCARANPTLSPSGAKQRSNARVKQSAATFPRAERSNAPTCGAKRRSNARVKRSATALPRAEQSNAPMLNAHVPTPSG